MKPRIWLNLALLLAVAGLASLLYFKPQSNAPSEYRLSTLQASDIQSITIDKPAELSLEKRDHGWFITRPFVARADTFQVERLLEILSATSQQRFPANDLKRFDLDQPQARLTLGKQAFSFGALNPLTAEQYVATADNVYLVSPRYGAAAAVPPDNFLNHLLLTKNETPTGFDLPGYKLARVNGAWSVSPAPAELSQDQLNRFADEWRHAYSSASEPANPAPGAEQIRIMLDNGGSVLLHILQKRPQLILLRDDEMIAYHFPGDVAKRLLDPFAAASKAQN
ncbi:MAG: DUF4340 domain-containing protein [Burkholderiales bacterium]